jgi:glycosyltransferase involved in cell wall biosynthesis
VNILLVNWLDRENPQAGGAEVHLFEVFGRLAARGHRVRLLCSGWQGCAPRALIQGIEVQRVGSRLGFVWRARPAFRQAVNAERPDVVLENINKMPLFLAGATTAAFVVLVNHLLGEVSFEEAGPVAGAALWLLERQIPWGYRRAQFEVVSESTRADLVARGVPAERIRVIESGVDTRRLCPDPRVPRAVPPRFLYLGRLKRYKGVDLAIQALAAARRTLPQLGLDIVGGGDDRPRLERLVARLGLQDAVRFHGVVGEEEKLRLFRAATANLFPSRKEGWGMTNVEAGACGTPSIAADSPGLRDSVRHGETGFLVPHGDVAALAERMRQLAEDPAVVTRLGAAARRFAETLSWEHAADLTERHFATLLGADGA